MSTARKVQLGLLVLVALLIVGFLLTAPVMRNIEASEKIDVKQAELEKEQAKTEDLRLRQELANDLGFLEEEARRIGYVLPGEVPVIMVEEEVPAEPAVSADSAAPNP